MKYLLMICVDPAEEIEVSPDADGAGIEAWLAEMDRRKARLDGSQLRPTSEAVTVRVRDEGTLLTDGPFAETKEQMAGFDIIECATMDEAVEIAALHPVAKFGMVEVRQFWQD
jgi:hypothetical protein